VLWLAAEGEREVDKRIRAAVTALGCDPDNVPIYVQTMSVPKMLADNGEKAVMQIVGQTVRAAKVEFDLPLVFIAIDTMIKAAGYKKSENDSVEINNAIRVMENVSIRAKCFVLAIDHMGKDEERGARGSSDKPSSVDAYLEIKPGIGGSRILHAIKVKGEQGDDQIEFTVVGTTQDEGQNTGFVRWGKWTKLGEGAKTLNNNARLLLSCVQDVIAKDGVERPLLRNAPPVRCVRMKDVFYEFAQRHRDSKRHDVAFDRSWGELAIMGLVSMVKAADGSSDMGDWAHLGVI
jgi:hypothetical protein